LIPRRQALGAECTPLLELASRHDDQALGAECTPLLGLDLGVAGRWAAPPLVETKHRMRCNPVRLSAPGDEAHMAR
jgi:hypothetical protein